MQDFLLEMEKDEYYKKLLESLPKEERDGFILYVENLSRKMGEACKKFDNVIQDASNLEILINEIGDALGNRTFKDNVGVQEGPWLTIKKD